MPFHISQILQVILVSSDKLMFTRVNIEEHAIDINTCQHNFALDMYKPIV